MKPETILAKIIPAVPHGRILFLPAGHKRHVDFILKTSRLLGFYEGQSFLEP